MYFPPAAIHELQHYKLPNLKLITMQELKLQVDPHAYLPGRNCLLLSSILYLLKPILLLSSLTTVSGYKKLLTAMLKSSTAFAAALGVSVQRVEVP